MEKGDFLTLHIFHLHLDNYKKQTELLAKGDIRHTTAQSRFNSSVTIKKAYKAAYDELAERTLRMEEATEILENYAMENKYNVPVEVLRALDIISGETPKEVVELLKKLF